MTRQQDVSQLAKTGQAMPVAMTRAQKLERWADILDKHGQRVATLPGTEYMNVAKRDQLQVEGSAISVAAADPVFQTMGLMGDTYGDAKRFFEMDDEQLHDALCHCHHHGQTHIPAATAAERIRAFASPDYQALQTDGH